MIKLLKEYFTFEDERGLITGLVQEGTWREVNIVSSRKGTRRGDHYHKLATELFIILSGRIRLHLQSTIDPDKTMVTTMKKGDVFIIDPNVNHTFEVLEDSQWINMLDKIIKDDMYRVN